MIMVFSTVLRYFRQLSLALLVASLSTACASVHENVFIAPTAPETQVASLELLNFRLIPEASKQHVQWETADEFACSYFVVERSTDEGTFQEIGRVPGDPMAVSARHHEFVDTTPSATSAQYRLRQVDVDGLVHTSKVLQAPSLDRALATR
jgi:hypothetical protein